MQAFLQQVQFAMEEDGEGGEEGEGEGEGEEREVEEEMTYEQLQEKLRRLEVHIFILIITFTYVRMYVQEAQSCSLFCCFVQNIYAFLLFCSKSLCFFCCFVQNFTVYKILRSNFFLLCQELQQLQQSNREKLSTINQSVESPEVQAALQRNPDISKERSNLLQGITQPCKVLCNIRTVEPPIMNFPTVKISL